MSTPKAVAASSAFGGDDLAHLGNIPAESTCMGVVEPSSFFSL